MGDLERQLVRIRSAAHDDLADAEQGLVQLLENPKSQQKKKPKDDAFNWWRDKAIKFKNKNKKGNPFVFGQKNKVFTIPSTEGYQ